MLEGILTEIKNHRLEYLFLSTASTFFLIFISLFSGQRLKQLFILAFFIIYYILWGVVHHAREQTLSLKIMIEYLAIGAIAMAVLFTLLTT